MAGLGANKVRRLTNRAKLRAGAAAIKETLFHPKRPPRPDSFMPLLGSARRDWASGYSTGMRLLF